MKLKLNKDGSAVVRNGAPVYILGNGTEREIDGAAAWNLMLAKHFETSPLMAGLKLPADMAASFFGDSFRIEAGKLVAVDKHGIQLYSTTRHGEAADFNEAFAQLVNAYPNKAMIQREGGAGAAPGGAASAGQQHHHKGGVRRHGAGKQGQIHEGRRPHRRWPCSASSQAWSFGTADQRQDRHARGIRPNASERPSRFL